MPFHKTSALTSLRLLVDTQRSHKPPRSSTLHNRRSLSFCLLQQLHALCSLLRGEHRLRELRGAHQRCLATPWGALKYWLLGTHEPSHSSIGRATPWSCVTG